MCCLQGGCGGLCGECGVSKGIQGLWGERGISNEVQGLWGECGISKGIQGLWGECSVAMGVQGHQDPEQRHQGTSLEQNVVLLGFPWKGRPSPSATQV